MIRDSHTCLFEDTVSVSQAIPPSWKVERSQTIQKTSRQPAQATIAQRSVVLLVNDVFDAKTQLRQAGLGHVLLANVQHGIVEGTAHEELEREVVDALAVGKRVALLGPVPLQDQSVAEGQRRGRIGGRLVAVEHATGEGRLDMPDYLSLEGVLLLEALGAVFGPRLALGLRDGSCWESANDIISALLLSERNDIVLKFNVNSTG